MLKPVTAGQLQELLVQLRAFNVLALRTDKPTILNALQEIKQDERPHLPGDHRAARKDDADERAVNAPRLAEAIAHKQWVMGSVAEASQDWIGQRA